MRKVLAAILVVSLCAGCAKEEEPGYGNLAGVNSADLVQDAVFIMFENYPPARTRLALVQPVDDDFGARLVEALRLHGYAVAEYVEPEKKKGWRSAKTVEKPDGAAFAYLIDGAGAENEIRVNIHVGSESLSRLYQVTGESKEAQYVPQGFWSHRKDGGEKDEPAI